MVYKDNRSQLLIVLSLPTITIVTSTTIIPMVFILVIILATLHILILAMIIATIILIILREKRPHREAS